MAFLHRLASNLKDGLTSLTNGAEPTLKTLHKQTSRGRKSIGAPFGFLEEHTRSAIAAFVQDKFDKGECKPHVFTQFWLQFPKLEAGFEILRRQLEQRTGCREGPLPLAVLQASPSDFGLDTSSVVMQELCSKTAAQKCTDIDFVGLVMLLLVVHLTEPASVSLQPDVRTMLSCLELAFTHFNSARRGKLDKREVAEALQYESAKAHTKEGRSGRTSNRLAHRLFEGLDWENDNTITFENFLRGIIQLVQDEYGDVGEEDEESQRTTPTAAAAAAGGGNLTMAGRRCGSQRVEGSATGGRGGDAAADHRRSASATGMSAAGVTAPGATAGSAAVGEGSTRRSGSFAATLKGVLGKLDTEGASSEERRPQ